MRTYDTYKDSGISWLGQIPSHWDVRRTKTIWEEHVSLSETGTEQLLSVSQYDGVKPNDEGSRSESLVGYKVVDSSNLVINIMLAWLGGLGVSQYKGIVSPAYCVYKLKENHCPEYFHYLYRTAMYLAEFARKSTGVVPSRWRMYTDSFGTVLSLVPPLAEQEAIVAYLDNATAEIDKAIASQQRMVELLQERKQIIINQAVTQGLNPDAPMKLTNIDWLPQIPAHWQLYRLGALGAFSKGSGIARDDLQDEGLPAILYGDIYTKYEISVRNLKNKISEKTAQNAVKIQAGDILLTGSGETKEDIGKTILYEGNEAYAGGDVIIFRQQSQDGKFLSYLLNSFYSRRYKAATSKGEIVVHTYPYILKDLYLPIPPLEEQEGIAYKLDKNCSEIEAAITRCEQKIALLTERKQILINDVVTGKIKVA